LSCPEAVSSEGTTLPRVSGEGTTLNVYNSKYLRENFYKVIFLIKINYVFGLTYYKRIIIVILIIYYEK